MSYIQNKLEDNEKHLNVIENFIRENVANKYKEKTRSLFIQYHSLLSQNGNFEDIGKLDAILKKIIEQSLTDFHNHILEKIDKNIAEWEKGKYHTNIAGGAMAALKNLRASLLQDTNPKE